MEWWWWVECWWFPNMRSEVEHPESETWMRYLFEVIEIPGVRLPGPMSRKIGGRDLERGSRRRGWVDSVQAVFVSKDLRDRRHTSMTFSVSNLTWCFELSLSEVVWGDTPCGSTPWSAMVSGFGWVGNGEFVKEKGQVCECDQPRWWLNSKRFPVLLYLNIYLQYLLFTLLRLFWWFESGVSRDWSEHVTGKNYSREICRDTSLVSKLWLLTVSSLPTSQPKPARDTSAHEKVNDMAPIDAVPDIRLQNSIGLSEGSTWVPFKCEPINFRFQIAFNLSLLITQADHTHHSSILSTLNPLSHIH